MTDDSSVRGFIENLYSDIVSALSDSEGSNIDPQYQLGIRKLAKAFFDNFDLFELEDVFPNLQRRDVDAWYAGTEGASDDH